MVTVCNNPEKIRPAVSWGGNVAFAGWAPEISMLRYSFETMIIHDNTTTMDIYIYLYIYLYIYIYSDRCFDFSPALLQFVVRSHYLVKYSMSAHVFPSKLQIHQGIMEIATPKRQKKA